MPTDQLTYTGNLVIVRCWCGVRVGIPSELDLEQKRNPKLVAWCPVGHEFIQGGPSEAEKRADRLARELAQEQANAARLVARNDQQAAALRHEQHSNRALKGHLTRMKRRIANGVCPVPGCKRSGFAQVMRHIAAKHPEWHAEHAHDLDA